MSSYKNTHKYDDIIDMEHHISSTHPHMDIYDRAAQFAPFAALTGHKDAVNETARLTDNKINLDDDIKMELDEKLQLIYERINEQPEVTFTYYVADNKKSGGAYITKLFRVKKIDMYKRTIVMTDKTCILIDNICKIEL